MVTWLSQKENDTSSETKLKVTEDCHQNHCHDELQENSARQLSELRNNIDEQKEDFTKEIGTLKEDQTEILERKGSVSHVKKAREGMETEMQKRFGWERENYGSRKAASLWELSRSKRKGGQVRHPQEEQLGQLCDELNVSPHNPCAEAPDPKVMALGGGASGRWWGFDDIMRVEPP